MSMGALRLQDVRLASRAVGDCRDVGHDTRQWQALAMQAVGRLVGAAAVTGGEGHWRRPPEPLAPVSTYSIGLDDSAQALLLTYVREVGVNADPIFLKLQRRSGRVETVRRGDVVSNRDWYQAATFIDFCRPASLDHSLTSIYRRPSSDAMSCIRLHRERGDRDFSDRERALMRFFHDELGRLIGGSLASVLDSDAQSLSPRLRETLSYLLEGDSEKQVALRMTLSRATVHQYVTMLYRRFGVQSRAELLTTVLRRRVRP